MSGSKRASELDHEFNVPVVLRRIGSAAMVARLTFAKDGSLYLLGPRDANFGDIARSSIHASGVQQTHYGGEGTDLSRVGDKVRGSRGPERHLTKGIRHLRTNLKPVIDLRWDYSPKPDRADRMNIVMEDAEMPDGLVVVAIYDVEPDRDDLIERVLRDPFGGIGRCVCHSVVKAAHPWVLIKVSSIRVPMTIEQALNLEFGQQAQERKPWEPCPCGAARKYRDCCLGDFAGMRPTRRPKPLLLP